MKKSLIIAFLLTICQLASSQDIKVVDSVVLDLIKLKSTKMVYDKYASFADTMKGTLITPKELTKIDENLRKKVKMFFRGDVYKLYQIIRDTKTVFFKNY